MKTAGDRQLAGLTNEGLIARLREAMEGGEDAPSLTTLREAIIARNVGLVKSIARGFVHSGEPLEDLTQVGYIGLLSAVLNFDLSRGNRFSTYATYLIKGEIRHHIRDKHATIRIPQWVQTMNRRVKQAEETLFQEKGRPPTLDELSERLEISGEQLTELLRGREAMTYVSIDEKRREEDPRPVAPRLASVGARGGTGVAFDVRMRIVVAIEELADIQRQVIEGLFYEGKTQSEVGSELGMSQRQVSRMKARILKEMKERLDDEDPETDG